MGFSQKAMLKHALYMLLPFIMVWQINAVASTNSKSKTISYNRYETSTILTHKKQTNPLLSTVTMTFSNSIVSIGEAMNYLLQFSGYQVMPEIDQKSALYYRLQQPLPFVNRTIHNMKIQEALRLFAGKSLFTLIQDPLHRYISFQMVKKAKPLWSEHDR